MDLRKVALMLMPLAPLVAGCAGTPAASRAVPAIKAASREVASVEPAASASKPAATTPLVATAAMPGKTVANALPQPAPGAPAPKAETAAEDAPFNIVGQVIRGEPLAARSVAYVDVERCFDVIPSYRRVRSERNAKEYARYLLLVAEANDEFRAAIEWVALRRGLDVVVTKTGVNDKRAVDITEVVCERLNDQRSSGLTR